MSAAVVDDVAPDHVLLAAVAVAGVPVLASAVVGHAQLVQVAGGVGIAVLLDAAIGVWNSAAFGFKNAEECRSWLLRASSEADARLL